MRIVFIGTVELSRKILEHLIGLKADIVGLLTKECSNFNADFVDLSPICKENNIPFRFVQDINHHDNIKWVKDLRPDIIFCFGWSYLLKHEVLKIAPMGVVGFHPASLPQNRGRHPIVWALVLGLEETASTFFFMDEGADTGDILSQEEVMITYEDNARTLYDKIVKTTLKQVTDFLPELKNKTFRRIPQDHSKANYWRKRQLKDGEIDFRMSSKAVYNLVRALTEPYIGAHVVYKGKEVKVWEAVETDFHIPNIEYGKILDVEENKITVKCYDNAIILTRHEFYELPQVGEYL